MDCFSEFYVSPLGCLTVLCMFQYIPLLKILKVGGERGNFWLCITISEVNAPGLHFSGHFSRHLMIPENKNNQLAGPFLKTALQCSRSFMALIRSFSTITREKQNTIISSQEKKNQNLLYKTAIDDEVLVAERVEVNMWSFFVKSELSWLTKWSSWALLSRIVEMSAEQLCSFRAGHRESSRLGSHTRLVLLLLLLHTLWANRGTSGTRVCSPRGLS